MKTSKRLLESNLDIPDGEIKIDGKVNATYANAINVHNKKKKETEKVLKDAGKVNELKKPFLGTKGKTSAMPNTPQLKKLKLSESLFEDYFKKPTKRKLREGIDDNAIKNALLEWLKNESYFTKNENGYEVYEYQIDFDYRDEVPEDIIEKVMESDNKRDTYEELMNDLLWDSEIEYVDEFIDEALNYIIRKHPDFEEDEVRDWLVNNFQDYAYVHYNYDDLLGQEIGVSLMIDTGDSDYDFTLNPNYNTDLDNPEIDDKASIVWLAQTQGYSKEQLIDAIKTGNSNSKFLKSVAQEVYDASSDMNILTFLGNVSLKNIIDYNNSSITVTPKAICGFYDSWSGGGSILDIQLEKNVIVDSTNIYYFGIDGGNGYAVYDVYGMSKDGFPEDAFILNSTNESFHRNYKRKLKEEFDEDYKYKVNAYFDEDINGLEDSFETNDFEELKDWVWEHLSKGSFIEAINIETGNDTKISPDDFDWESDDDPNEFLNDALKGLNESFKRKNKKSIKESRKSVKRNKSLREKKEEDLWTQIYNELNGNLKSSDAKGRKVKSNKRYSEDNISTEDYDIIIGVDDKKDLAFAKKVADTYKVKSKEVDHGENSRYNKRYALRISTDKPLKEDVDKKRGMRDLLKDLEDNQDKANEPFKKRLKEDAYRDNEDPRALEKAVKKAEREYEKLKKSNASEEELLSKKEELDGLRERENFAWQDEEANESLKKKFKKSLKEDVLIKDEYTSDLSDFEFWSGGLETASQLSADELNKVADILGDTYPDGMTETEVNDFFWFENDTIAEWLGYDNFEEIMNREGMNESVEDKWSSAKEIYDEDDEDDENYAYSDMDGNVFSASDVIKADHNAPDWDVEFMLDEEGFDTVTYTVKADSIEDAEKVADAYSKVNKKIVSYYRPVMR